VCALRGAGDQGRGGIGLCVDPEGWALPTACRSLGRLERLRDPSPHERCRFAYRLPLSAVALAEMSFSQILRLSLILLAISAGQVSAAGQAPSSSESSSKPHKPPAHAQAAGVDAGSFSGGVYRSSFFAFRYKVPFGWVDRTREMGEGSEPGRSVVLLAMFERPPQAAGDSVNSAVIIAAESLTAYPGLKTAGDYFEPLTELTASKGFKAVNEPYEFASGGKRLVRGDFSKGLGTMRMLQSTLASIQKGYVLSFTFIAGDEEGIESLIEGLSFAAGKASDSGQSPTAH
jgi:hypothetical protein